MQRRVGIHFKGVLMKRYKVLGKTVSGVESSELFLPNGKVKNMSAIAASCLHKTGADSTHVKAIEKTPVDISWLPAASQAYKISPNIRDYVVAGVPYITSDFPNRNLQAFTQEEILKFRPNFGRVTYRTFVGKPTFQDHKNDDPLQAKGVNLDAIINYVPKYKVYKILVLSAFDRTKDPDLASAIANKEINTYSMGAWVELFTCSICGADANNPTCSHFTKIGKGNIAPGRQLVYQNCCGVEFFEGSSVSSPADVTAVGEDVYTFD
jgi:hypothetical protein